MSLKLQSRSNGKHSSTRRKYESVATTIFQPIGFGKKSERVRKLFRNFRDFSLIESIENLGESSSNALVFELNMVRKTKGNLFRVSTAMKMGRKMDSDSLYYEYIVGRAINRFALRFPCFVETYDLFEYESEKDYYCATKLYAQTNEKKEETKAFKEALARLKRVQKREFATLPEDPRMMTLSIQHFHDAITISHLKDDKECPLVLLQIYLPLLALEKQFVHNDLKGDNILLQPVKPIRFIYKRKDGPDIQFVSHYIAKIIDYARCFFDVPDDASMYGNTDRFLLQSNLNLFVGKRNKVDIISMARRFKHLMSDATTLAGVVDHLLNIVHQDPLSNVNIVGELCISLDTDAAAIFRPLNGYDPWYNPAEDASRQEIVHYTPSEISMSSNHRT